MSENLKTKSCDPILKEDEITKPRSLEEQALLALLASCETVEKFADQVEFKKELGRIRHLAEELAWLSRRFELLLEVVANLAEMGPQNGGIERAIEGVGSIVGAERALVLFYAEPFEAFDQIEAPGFEKIDSPLELKIILTLAEDVRREKVGLMNPNLQLDPRFAGSPAVSSLSQRTLMVVPMSLNVEGEAECIGVVYVDRSAEKQSFTEHDYRILKAFAKLVALSTRHVRVSAGLRLAYQDTVHALVKALEAKDPYTRGHSERVAEYAVRCAKRFAPGMKRLEVLRSAALLHDIGKIGIRDEVLKKPGRLTRDEYDHVKLHPEISVTILEGLNFLEEEMAILRQHHERYDGTGYPKGLKGDEISLEGAIIQVADAWDAMTSNRVYRAGRSVEEALEDLRKNAGTQFNPKVVETFIQMIQEEGLIVEGEEEEG